MAKNQRLTPGDIVIVSLPSSDGHEQTGRRPSIVITSVTKEVITAIPLTTNKSALYFPHSVSIKPTDLNKLSFESVALVFQVRALDVKRCESRLGKLDKEVFKKILKELRQYLGL